MRSTVLASLLAACNKLPEPPSAADFAAMTDEQKCEATAPRATRCTDELLVAELRDISGDDAFAAEIGRDYATGPRPDADEAHTIHQLACRGDRDGAYQKAVFACWDVTDCSAFARCVYKPRVKGAAAR